MSAPALDKNSIHHRNFLRYSQFSFAGQAGRVRCIVICINPASTQMIDGTETSSAIQRMNLVIKGNMLPCLCGGALLSRAQRSTTGKKI